PYSAGGPVNRASLKLLRPSPATRNLGANRQTDHCHATTGIVRTLNAVANCVGTRRRCGPDAGRCRPRRRHILELLRRHTTTARLITQRPTPRTSRTTSSQIRIRERIPTPHIRNLTRSHHINRAKLKDLIPATRKRNFVTSHATNTRPTSDSLIRIDDVRAHSLTRVPHHGPDAGRCRPRRRHILELLRRHTTTARLITQRPTPPTTRTNS